MCSVHVDIELMAALYKRARMSQVFVVDAKQYEKLIKTKTIQTTDHYPSSLNFSGYFELGYGANHSSSVTQPLND